MTSILPTIGPKTENEKDIKFLFKYCKAVRLNGSHNSLKWHKLISNKIKKIDKNKTILLDIPGVKPRTANEINILIKKNEKIIFYFKKKPKKSKNFQYIEITNPLPKIRKKFFFSINDGEFQFKIIKISKNYIIGKSLQNLQLLPKKGINIPYSIYNNKLQEKKIIRFIKKAINFGVKFDSIGLSFVQNDNILKKVKRKFPNYSIVSKIENSEGLKNVEKIILNSDCIMIDRGDLGAEIQDYNLYKSIKKISELSTKYSKALIMATDNLTSMKSRIVPTKSEIYSIEHSIKIESDQIMLSEETALFDNWKNIIFWLNRYLKKSNSFEKKLNYKFDDYLKKIKCNKMIIFSKKGYLVNNINIDQKTHYYIFTESQKVINISNFKSNITSFKIKFPTKKKDISYIYENIKKNLNKIFLRNEEIILVHISFPRINSRANTISMISKKDFI
tara:strand:- start:142 stop:1482 length:1341 start_codon:yes stop_codon:yes gene_type:complete